MAFHQSLNSFLGGEVSPNIDARIDLQKYNSSLRVMENFRPMPWGGATARAGLYFIAEAKFANRKCRVLRFNYSTDITYVIEMGHLYMRFYYGNGVRIGGSSGEADYFNRYLGYGVGEVVQSFGLIYQNIMATAPAVPPASNNYPASDPTHWSLINAYELVSPYSEEELFRVQYLEINDVVYMVHPDHPVYKLSRLTAATFSITEIVWSYPPLLDENIDQDFTMALGATSGTTTLTASAPYFNADMVGAYFEINHINDASSEALDLSGSAGTVTSAAVKVQGNWRLYTRENWYGTIQLERSTDGGATWRVSRESKSASNHNVELSGTEPSPLAGQPVTQLRMTYTAAGDPFGLSIWTNPPNSYVKASAYLEVENAFISGLVKITGYTSTTVVTVLVINEAFSTDVTASWSEGAWSNYRGFPMTLGLVEQRLLLGGTYYKPNTVWASGSADFENFQRSDLDDASFVYQPASTEQNPAKWICALDRAYMGTAGDELAISSGTNEEALTPANVTVRSQSGNGSEAIQPLVVGKAILFVSRQGRRIRELTEGNPFLEKGGPAPADLTILAEHITEGGITEMDFAKLPDQTVYAIRGDGTLLVMNYNKEQNENAWARYKTTSGAFESVACVYGSPADVVFTVVARNLPSGTKRYIEVFTAESTDVYRGIHGMDCAVLVEQEPSVTVSVGPQLEGVRVAVVADGAVIGDANTGVGALTVTGGVITLPYPASIIRVGVPFFPTLQPMKIDANLGSGTTQGRKRRISEVCLRLRNTLGGWYGNAGRTLLAVAEQQIAHEIEFRKPSMNMDEPVPLFTGDVLLKWADGQNLKADIKISQLQPLPFTVLGIFAKMEFMGE